MKKSLNTTVTDPECKPQSKCSVYHLNIKWIYVKMSQVEWQRKWHN